MPTFRTAEEYIESLPEERAQALAKLRTLIRKKLPKGYEETILYGMITYVVPLSRYPRGYNGKKDQALPYLSLASQKNHMALYAMAIGAEEERLIRSAFLKANKKLDMGKGCIRFRTLEDLVLPAIGELVARKSVSEFIDMAEEAMAAKSSSRKPTKKTASRNPSNQKRNASKPVG